MSAKVSDKPKCHRIDADGLSTDKCMHKVDSAVRK